MSRSGVGHCRMNASTVELTNMRLKRRMKIYEHYEVLKNNL